MGDMCSRGVAALLQEKAELSSSSRASGDLAWDAGRNDNERRTAGRSQPVWIYFLLGTEDSANSVENRKPVPWLSRLLNALTQVFRPGQGDGPPGGCHCLWLQCLPRGGTRWTLASRGALMTDEKEGPAAGLSQGQKATS